LSETAAGWLAGRTPAEAAIETVWGHGLHRLTLSLHATTDPTPDALTTSVRGVLFRRGGVMVVRDPGADHVIPGGRREAGERLEATLAREIAEETGWTYASARPFAAMHFRHETPKPEGYQYPYPDFFQRLYVLEAADHDRRRIVRDGWESRSRLMPIGRALSILAPAQTAILRLALAARL